MSEAATVTDAPEEEEPKLAYEIEIDLPDLPKGELVQIAGLGTFENKGAYDITEEEAQRFRVYHSSQEVVRGDQNELLGSKLVVGPTLLQASKNMHGVEVSRYGKQDDGGDE